jgi:hypothetical protein
LEISGVGSRRSRDVHASWADADGGRLAEEIAGRSRRGDGQFGLGEDGKRVRAPALPDGRAVDGSRDARPRHARTSPQLYARIGGVLDLIIIVIGFLGEFFVRDRLIVVNRVRSSFV